MSPKNKLASLPPEFNRELLEAIPGAFYVIDENARFVAWNAFMRDVIAGKHEEQMLGSDAVSHAHPDDIPKVVELIGKMFVSCTEERTPARILLHGGPEYIWLDMRGRRIIIDGKPYLIGTGTDITETRRAEAMREFSYQIVKTAETLPFDTLLHEVVDFAERFTESAIGFFHLFNTDESLFVHRTWSARTRSNCSMEVDSNPQMLRESGVWADAIRERRTLIHNDFASWQNREFLPEGHTELLRELVVPICRADKVVAVMGVGNKPFDYNEKDVAWLESFADLAWETIARKQAEQSERAIQEKLIQSQKMELIGQLAGGIAHDFNNILSVILGQTELAMLDGNVSRTHEREFEVIRQTASRAMDLTRQLLAFARRQPVEPGPMNLNTKVESLLDMLQRVIGSHITLSWKPWPNDLEITIDSSQLDQILMNFCVNARDAINGIGNITISTFSVDVSDTDVQSGHPCLNPGRYAMMSVTDNGSGMDRSVLPHIFEPFFTTKEAGKGSGLGLATVYGIVRQNQGAVECTSEPGKGTVFNVFFPLSTLSENKSQVSSHALQNRKATKTILLVEDEPEILKIARLILEKSSYNVIAASSAEDALGIFEQHRNEIDLLVTDVIMPGMNGAELSMKLQREVPGLKTLFMSGYTAEIVATHEAIHEGAGFIQKPFSVKTFKAKVEEVLDSVRC